MFLTRYRGIYMPSLGTILKLFRTKQKLQQSEMAQQLNVTANFLSQVENDKKTVSFSKLEEIAGQLGVSKELLLIAASEPPSEMNTSQRKHFDKMQQARARLSASQRRHEAAP